jgi:hypothetical protein
MCLSHELQIGSLWAQLLWLNKEENTKISNDLENLITKTNFLIIIILKRCMSKKDIIMKLNQFV